MLITSQEICWEGRSSTNSSPALQEHILESQKLQFDDLKNDLTMNSYDTIELLKQSLKQLSNLTQQQAQQEHTASLQALGDVEEAPETLERTTSLSLLKLIEEYDQPRSVLLSSRSKTLSRRNSLSSQVSTSSNKSVRFGNVSIVAAQELTELSVTTVDDFERECSARKHERQKKPSTDKTDILEEYVKMAQSTRRRKTPERTNSTSNLSHSEDTKARRLSLFRKREESRSVNSVQKARSSSSSQNDNDSVASSKASRSSSHRSSKQRNRPSSSSRNGNDNHSAGSSKASRTSSHRSPKQRKSSPPTINKGFFVTKMFSKTFKRRKGKHDFTQPPSNPTDSSNNNDHVDISEVTMDDNITETSSNDDSAAILMKDIRYQQQRRRTPQKSLVPEQPPRRGVRRSNSGASSVASSRSLVQRAARLLLRRPSTNHSDVCSVASSIASIAESVVREDSTPLHQSIVIVNEITDETLDDDSDTPPINEDAAKLQYEIADLKKQLMGLVMEHMEESEKQKQLKLQSKRDVPATAS
jgi:hypothetical protein